MGLGGEQPVGAVAGVILGCAATVGLAALAVALDEGAGTAVADGSDAAEQLIASGGEGMSIGSSGTTGPPDLKVYILTDQIPGFPFAPYPRQGDARDSNFTSRN